jgi:hypothetical protein
MPNNKEIQLKWQYMDLKKPRSMIVFQGRIDADGVEGRLTSLEKASDTENFNSTCLFEHDFFVDKKKNYTILLLVL